MKEKFVEKILHYKFELKHITVLIVVLIIFQVTLSVIQKTSLNSFLNRTQTWYQQDSAEKIASLSATSLELLLENIHTDKIRNEEEKQKAVQSFNIIFSQQLLQQNVYEICLILKKDNHWVVIDEGIDLLKYLNGENLKGTQESHEIAFNYFNKSQEKIKSTQEIHTFVDSSNRYHIFVPFVPNGEYLGVFYMQNSPDLTFITNEIVSSYDEVAIIYSALILLGLLAMYYISTYTIKERDRTQQELFNEKQAHMKEQIMHEKESLFTKRIYHTHHKAEKVMGFIKEDLRQLTKDKIEEIKYRVTKYSNFVSRVIYDMKWYDPPLNTIRNPLFRTNVNDVIRFLIDHLFLRISSHAEMYRFNLELDEKVPPVNVNEFVLWEILEPLIQNSIDHSNNDNLEVTIRTQYLIHERKILISIEDNGEGIDNKLLEKDEKGVKKIFMENVSTKSVSGNSGYGCYIAYQIAVGKCGWKLDAINKEPSGCRFIITINI